MFRPTCDRYVRLRCPVCNAVSPVCDQQADIRRTLLQWWWQRHLDSTHQVTPIIEGVEV